ncbi:hypothetical protein BDV96DRAFT_499136 [Lophiotrema nucula]|uniref:Pentatricopeptide repeat domain-containing protein n=1 Tax=Lophiotrema nucula TaxID=690887 RepID=A0A6A5YX20_9PLEO|nr:hypothetical protein BDV96DRAFT_499136 [Lophiotrema nucula]
MLTCRACLRRCIRAVDPSYNTLRSVRRDATPFLLFAPQRNYSRAAPKAVRKIGTRPVGLNKVESLHRSKREPWQESSQAARVKKKERAALTRAPPTTNLTQFESTHASRNFGRRDGRIPKSEWSKRKRELQHLADPLELANFVKQQLGKDKPAEMLQLVQMASHEMQCIVSWNHIIDHCLAKGKVSLAVKTYNDMKKRAQFPDSYTYTILLRGLAINAHESGALEKALSIYHSMSAPNSRVQPTIIHTNAILKVCARALDMDAMWGIVAKMPDKGAGAADGHTYVTILNAIRQSLLVEPPSGETEDELAQRRDRGIVEGRRIWEDIVYKWREGDMVVEEELVCAMGRLLLIGLRPKDWDDVLSLVEQTMDIPRTVPPLGSLARSEAGLPRLRAHLVPDSFRYDDRHLTPEKNAPLPGEEFTLFTEQGIGTAVSNSFSKRLTYAKPSNNTLSLVLEACLKVYAAKAGESYWNTMTDPGTYNVVPDVTSFNFYLRLLRQTRSSAVMVELFKEDFVKKLELRPGTFRIAMSTCVRDRNNHNSLRHANQVIEIMSRTLEDADPKVVQKYAELATKFPLARGADLMQALLRLQPIISNLRLQLGIGGQRRAKDGDVGATYLTDSRRTEAIGALRTIFGLHDKLINSDLVSEEDKRPVKESRAKLSAFLHRLSFKAKAPKLKWGEDGNEVGEGEEKDTVSEVHGRNERRSGLARGPGAWRQQNVLPDEKRRSWFSPSAYNTPTGTPPGNAL